MTMTHAERSIWDRDAGKTACGAPGPGISGVEIEKIDCVRCLQIIAREWINDRVKHVCSVNEDD